MTSQAKRPSFLSSSTPFNGLHLPADDFGVARAAAIARSDGPQGIDGTSGPDTLNGTPGDDVINGLAGDDRLFGLEGNDTLDGGADNDFLDGGQGVDTLSAGSGNDIYIVDGPADIINETAGNGTDFVYSIFQYALASDVDVEVLAYYDILSTASFDLYGNNLANQIYGNAGVNELRGNAGDDALFAMGGNDNLLGGAGADHLDGGTGTDTMAGGAGDDVYISDGDNISESLNEGYDRIYTTAGGVLPSNVEFMSAVDHLSTNDLDLYGNNLANNLYGNAGANVINGGRGHDYLIGFGGADTFVFDTGLGDIDEIVDFTAGTDKLRLSSYIYGDVRSNNLASAFEVSTTGATRAATKIVYNPADGTLSFDFDGSGACAPIYLALLSPGLALTAGDFEATAPTGVGPVAVADSFTLPGGSPGMALDVFSNDTGPFNFVGVGGMTFVLAPGGLSAAVTITRYGSVSFGRNGGLNYTLNTTDPDYLALAPGATVADNFFYEITNGTASTFGTISLTFTKPLAGAPAPAAIAPPADHATLVGDAVFAAHDGATDPAFRAPGHARASVLEDLSAGMAFV